MDQQFVINVSDETFMQKVVDASQQQPVLVDFWATWCEPCKSLMPLLENLAQSYLGSFILAKIDIDQHQALATQFGVRSVPTVKLFKNGQIVDEFSGVLSETQIREFLDKHIDKESDVLMKQALAEYETGDKKEALTKMGNVIQGDKSNESNIVLYSKVLLKEGHSKEASQWLQTLSTTMKNTDEVTALITQIEFIDVLESAPDVETLEARIEQDKKDCEARYQLSAHYILQGRIEEALDQLLQIVMYDRTYNDDAGKNGLLKLFSLLGNEHPLVNKYRRKLAMFLN